MKGKRNRTSNQLFKENSEEIGFANDGREIASVKESDGFEKGNLMGQVKQRVKEVELCDFGRDKRPRRGSSFTRREDLRRNRHERRRKTMMNEEAKNGEGIRMDMIDEDRLFDFSV